MNDSVIGLILNQSDYREHDALVSVMTAEYGKISFIAAGIRKMTSKNAGSLLPYTRAEIQFDYKPDQTLFRLKTARTKQMYRHLHEDLKCSSAAAVAADVCMSLSFAADESMTCRQEYEFLEKTFSLINDGLDPTLVLALYFSDMMKLHGIAPDVDECVLCGNTQVSALSAIEGGFLCRECAQKKGLDALSTFELRRFRLIVKGGLEHCDIVNQACGASLNDLRILADMMKKHAGIVLRSFTFYERFCA